MDLLLLLISFAVGVFCASLAIYWMVTRSRLRTDADNAEPSRREADKTEPDLGILKTWREDRTLH